MINFLLKIKLLRKCKTFPTSNGMTYIEIIVVLSIFAILSTVVMYSYQQFQAKVDIKNLASDIALKIVEAQKSATNGKWITGVADDWKPSYGVYFDSTDSNDVSDGIYFNKKFIYFADFDDNGYSGLSSCTGTECLDKILITKNNFIRSIVICNDSNCSSPSLPLTLSIHFTRPDSGAVFSESPSTNSGYVQINIESPKGATAQIKIYSSGRVQVN